MIARLVRATARALLALHGRRIDKYQARHWNQP